VYAAGEVPQANVRNYVAARGGRHWISDQLAPRVRVIYLHDVTLMFRGWQAVVMDAKESLVGTWRGSLA
jgi:hypothetical protein